MRASLIALTDYQLLHFFDTLFQSTVKLYVRLKHPIGSHTTHQMSPVSMKLVRLNKLAFSIVAFEWVHNVFVIVLHEHHWKRGGPAEHASLFKMNERMIKDLGVRADTDQKGNFGGTTLLRT